MDACEHDPEDHPNIHPTLCYMIQRQPYNEPRIRDTWEDRAKFAEEMLAVTLDDLREFRLHVANFVARVWRSE